MFRFFSSHRNGYTLIEVVMAISVIGILGTLGFLILGTNFDAQKFEQTRQSLETYKRAILGDRGASSGKPNFGYAGDWGSLPGALTNLTVAQAPAWAFQSTYGVGAGWNGPYLEGGFTGTDLTQDAWGNPLVYAPLAAPATLTSKGSDGLVGGTGYAQDLAIQIPSTLWKGTVYGRVLNGSAGLSGLTVEIRYPVAGVLTAFTAVTSASGDFSFANVPFGTRAISITAPAPTLGPKQIVVDSNNYQIVPEVLNYFGTHP